LPWHLCCHLAVARWHDLSGSHLAMGFTLFCSY
jgi:hypothetical protein